MCKANDFNFPYFYRYGPPYFFKINSSLNDNYREQVFPDDKRPSCMLQIIQKRGMPTEVAIERSHAG